MLRVSYPILLAPAYEANLLAHAIPFLVQPVPALLVCGTWYLAEMPGNPGRILGCGGWTRAEPGGNSAPGDQSLAHLRHFATHPGCVRRGVGRTVFAQCVADARAAGVRAFESNSTFAAEPFYRALGFERLAPTIVRLGEQVDFPGVRMRLQLPA